MKVQNYAHHKRFVVGFHLVAGSLLAIGTIVSLINAYLQITSHDSVIGSILIVVLFICGLLLFWYARTFAVTVQDRAIRSEENLRHYILAHKPLDSRITMSQVIALRFAPDDEFLVLADRAAREDLTNDEIKRAIKNWRPDHYRA